MRAERDARRGVAWWSANAPRWATWPALLVALVLAGAVGVALFPREGETRFVDVATVKWRTREVTRWRTSTTYTAARRVTETTDGGTRIVEDGVREVSLVDQQATREAAGQVDERREVTTARPAWSAHLLPGVRFGDGDAPRLVVGGLVERRIIGPFSAGLWGAAEVPVVPTVKPPAAGVVGASLSLEW